MVMVTRHEGTDQPSKAKPPGICQAGTAQPHTHGLEAVCDVQPRKVGSGITLEISAAPCFRDWS